MKWKILSKKNVYENPWISVTHHEVIDPGGKEGIYGTVHFKNRAVGILPIDEEGYTWLVGQHRFPLNIYSWEIPEGGCAEGEDLLVAAKRELLEETGLVATKWEQILTMHLSNAVSDEVSYSYVARDLKMTQSEPESVEDLQVKRIPFSEVVAMVHRGEITDALSVGTILKYESLRKLTDHFDL